MGSMRGPSSTADAATPIFLPAGVRPSFSDRLCEAFALGFAGWTVMCQMTVLLGGSLRLLIGISALCLAGLLFGWWWSRQIVRKTWPSAQESKPADSLRNSPALN